ncbi:hypothetical protein HQ576_14740 [bacterium]|nr:hypothetical protein [bacterium]
MKAARLLVFALVPFLGCASILSKTSRQIRIKSQPEKAEVAIFDDKTGEKIFTGATPTMVTLETGGGFFRGKRYTVRLSKAGYDDSEITVGSKLNGWYFGNFIFGGVPGLLIVDPLTGAMWTLSPQDIEEPMTKKPSVSQGRLAPRAPGDVSVNLKPAVHVEGKVSR